MSLVAPSHAVILAIGLVAGLAAYDQLDADPTPEARPAPFDQLTPEEQVRAIETAAASPLVGPLLSERYQTIGASLRTDKELMRGMDPPRLADVQFYDYTTNKAIWAVVDLDADLVRSLEPVPVGYQPPMTSHEMTRAGEIARAAPEIAAHLPEAPVTSSGHLFATLTAPCDTHRCARVAFYDETLAWGFHFFAIVDLSTDTYVGLVEIGAAEATP